MKLKIASRLRPYSHKPGASALIPNSPYHVKAFPSRLFVYDNETLIFETELGHTGYVNNFTLLQDLEKGKLRLFGRGQTGYFAFEITHVETTILIKGVNRSFTVPVEKKPLLKGECERLSLGMHKAQEFELIARRGDLKEILPIWHYLGQQTPKVSCDEVKGNFHLLKACRQVVEKKERQALAPAFENLFCAGFDSLFCPKSYDDLFLGLTPNDPSSRALSPLPILTEGSRLIRRLFIEEGQNSVHFLPLLPPKFVSGRMVGIKVGSTLIDFEWTKGKIRIVTLTAKEDCSLGLKFPKEIKRFRMNRKESCDVGGSVTLKKGTRVILDRFEK